MNRGVRFLLKASDLASNCGDQEAYCSATANLKRGISQAKYNNKKNVEEPFNSSDPQHMWQGI